MPLTVGSRRRLAEWAEPVLLGLLIALVSVHAVCVCFDVVSAIRYPFELDYTEGIVWQQAALIPGPRMYSPSPAIPFVGFPYPPLYHLLVRAVACVMQDMLAAGRLISGVAILLIAILVAGLVLTASRRADARTIAFASVAGLLVFCLHAVRLWAMFLRVDMLAVALSLAGVMVAARADGRFGGTTCGLLLCLAAVYTRQTMLPSGLAVFAVTVLRSPRVAIGAGAIALGAGLAALGLLEYVTSGGFLRHILYYNINRYNLQTGLRTFRGEQSSFLPAAVMVVGAVTIARGLRSRGLGLGGADRATATRAMLLVYFALATPLLLTALKSGGSYNYFIDWLCVGCTLIGILLCDIAASGQRLMPVMSLLIIAVAPLPLRMLPDRFPQADLDRQAALVARIAAAGKPVASEDMTLLMRAGKPVIFEPSLATELALVGRWDETPLVEMIRAQGFAFMITTDDDPSDTDRRSPAVDAAMRQAYPRVEQVGTGLWLHLPDTG